MKAGEIYVVEIPELGGHEQNGVRPAVVVACVAKSIATIIPFIFDERDGNLNIGIILSFG